MSRDPEVVVVTSVPPVHATSAAYSSETMSFCWVLSAVAEAPWLLKGERKLFSGRDRINMKIYT